ncbi:MAG: hypothetical protein NC432_13310 [Roseburia sp.]|nr:hypothetical protein [Roseburia sp.]MCM1096519.1 hypothetical protein [Ruminococcus flavefaciens]
MGKGKRALQRLVVISGLGAAALWLWTADAESRAHYTPEYPREELQELLSKDSLTEEEYNLLFLQTGMGRAGVERLFQEGRQQELLYLQDRFFLPVEYECRQVNPFCRGERLLMPEREEIIVACRQRYGELPDAAEAGAFDFLPAVRTGDILVTFSGHFFGWRSGHAGIVIDGEEGLTLEAVSPGSVSRVCTVDSWEEYPCFALLRLKDSTEEEAAEIASYAAEYLTGVPYELFRLTERNGRSLLPGEGEEAARERGLNEEPISGTQCAHLVWSAFYPFGYDLDSDGGWIVTPKDLYESELLEVVQLYGLSPLRKD